MTKAWIGLMLAWVSWWRPAPLSGVVRCTAIAHRPDRAGALVFVGLAAVLIAVVAASIGMWRMRRSGSGDGNDENDNED